MPIVVRPLVLLFWLMLAAPSSAAVPVATPTPGLNQCDPNSPACPAGTECYCCCGGFRCLPPGVPCCALACSFPTAATTPTPPPTPAQLGIGELCEPDRICPPPLLCLIDPPHQARVCACVGDCNGNAQVTVDEIVSLVRIALGLDATSACPLGDANGDDTITIDEILFALNNDLRGCSVAPPSPTPECSEIPCGGDCVVCPPCTPGSICPAAPCRLGTCELNPLNGCRCEPTTAQTPPPTPALEHGHTCCECPAAACMDIAWIEVERACPADCETVMGAECEAPCQGGPLGGPASCVPLTPCAVDSDCDDGNGCSIDKCSIDGCTHACVCD